jgi:hypothetical protein
MKTNLLFLVSFVCCLFQVHAQTNSITVTSTIPATIEIGQTITVDYDYTLALNATDQQVKAGFTRVDGSDDYVANGDAAYSGGFGIGATTSSQSGSLTFTITQAASSTLAAGEKYVIEVVIQQTGAPYTSYAASSNNGTELTVNPATTVTNAISVTNTIPTSVTQGQVITINIDYSATAAGKLQVGIADTGSDDLSNEWQWNGWITVEEPAITATTGTVSTNVNITIPTTVNLSSGFTGHHRYRILIGLRNASTEVVAAPQIDPLTITTGASNNYTGASGGNWSLASNWSLARVPISTDNITINTNSINLDVSNISLNDLTITSGNTLNINAGNALTVRRNLSQNGTLNILSDATSSGSLIVNGTSTGNIKFDLFVNDTNWHLISPPVEGQMYGDTWNTANALDQTGQTNTLAGVSTYSNTSDSNGTWSYFIIGAANAPFNTAKGYSMKRTGAGTYSFTGTLKTDNASPSISANDIGGGNENRWTLIGNPFPSYISVTNLLGLAANETALENNREALYVWNGTSYVPETGYIHPGQAFFVNSDVASTSITINQDMLSHQTGVTFHKSASSNSTIKLMMTDGTKNTSTEINYLADKTTGLDRSFDIGTFTGQPSSLTVFTHLVSNSKGVNFMKQALPSSDLESMVIPVGVYAISGSELTFSLEALNFPSDIKVFLEDRNNNSFTRLDSENSELKIMTTSILNGIGRFYLHTKYSVLNTNNVNLENISIYKTNSSNLRIVGLSSGVSSIKLFNILGKQLLNNSFTSNGVHDFTLPNMTKGIYIVKLDTEIGSLSKKIILE